MLRWRTQIAVSVVLTLSALLAVPTGAGAVESRGQWHRSIGSIPVKVDQAILVKIDGHRLMWIGGADDQPADGRRAFIYDVRTQQFKEIAPLPVAKVETDFGLVGALADGSVVVAGGGTTDDPTRAAASPLSYRYLETRNAWVRTGNLPEAQSLVGTTTVLLPDGRLLAAGGEGLDFPTTGSGSAHAFVFDPNKNATVDEVDPATGAHSGRRISVRGAWDYTRTANGAVSDPSEAHLFGNLVRLADGRALLVAGHIKWTLGAASDVSVLSTHTDFFDPATGRWTQGPPLPAVAGEDDQLVDSHGGRTNGTCVAALPDDTVLIAGGNTASDGQSYFGTAVSRQSILLLNPGRDPAKSRYRLAPNRIPSGRPFSGLLGGPGRNQLPCYVLSRGRVLIAGGQSNVGEDLYDSYLFDPRTFALCQGPDMLHGTAIWAAQHPEYGYPADYVTSVISTREVSEHSSLLVFDGDTVVHGGAFNGVDYDEFGVPFVEQLTLR